MAYKGKFIPKNPKKYRGDPTAIVWRSTWELKFFNFCDSTPAVLEWASEEISIPYISPIDNKIHRYYPDVYMKIRKNDGSIVRRLIEIKPRVQTQQPKLQKRLTPRYIAEVKTWGVNQSKWDAAERFCKEHNMEFTLITESELFGQA